MQGFFEEVKKFTDTRRAMKSIEFLYDEGMMDYMTYNHFDASKMGAGQEFTVAGKLNGKQLGNFKSFDTQLKITEPSGDERIIKQSYEVISSSRTTIFDQNCNFSNKNRLLSSKTYFSDFLESIFLTANMFFTKIDVYDRKVSFPRKN